MSDIISGNEALLERTGEALDLAGAYTEQYLGTYMEKALVGAVSSVTHHIDTNDLEAVAEYSLPHLEKLLNTCSNELAKESQENIYGAGIIEATDAY